jgi:hypothetical protein
MAESRCVFLARLSFHTHTECGILAGEPLLARPIV